jgi:hypothetical protein
MPTLGASHKLPPKLDSEFEKAFSTIPREHAQNQKGLVELQDVIDKTIS